MKIRSLTIRIPSPRKEETPADALRRILIARSACTDLRKRLGQK